METFIHLLGRKPLEDNVLEVTMRDGNKRGYISIVVPSFSVLEVTMRDGNSSLTKVLPFFSTLNTSFRSDYEGWKQTSAVALCPINEF